MLPEKNWQELLEKYKFQISFLLVGAILIGLGVLITKTGSSLSSNKVEIIEEVEGEEDDTGIGVVVEVSGSVESPGVFKLPVDSRIEDVLIAAGGLSAQADRIWVEKTINRAAKVTDGQKVYIASISEQTEVLSANLSGGGQNASVAKSDSASQLINVNYATQNQLESLWGIGPVTAQNIIEQRPYSSVEELLSKKILKNNVYKRNEDLLSVY